MTACPDLLDFTSFFEAEPTRVNEELGWYYGAHFDSIRGEDRVHAMIAPGDGQLTFRWWSRGSIRIDLTLQGIVEWILECQPGRERLLLKFHQPGVEYWIIELRPQVNVSGVIHSS